MTANVELRTAAAGSARGSGEGKNKPDLDEIPILDVGPYLAGVPGSLESLAAELGHACEAIGFYFVVNHGITQELIERAFAQAARFHALPLDEKMKVKKGEHYVGYTAIGGLRINTGDGFDNTKNQYDLQAAYHYNRDFSSDHPAVKAGKRYHVPNPWPANLPGFRETSMEYHRALETLGLRLLPVYATALGAPKDYFDKAFIDALDWVRMIYYPPVEVEAENQMGLGEHTDAGFLTFLPQTAVAGLEVMTQSGKWIPQPKVPGSLLVNAGQTLKRWSNNRFLATPHRVVSPKLGVARYSMPIFFNPGADAVIECIDSCVSADNPCQYPPMRYGDFLDWYIANTYEKHLENKAAS